MNRTLPPGDRGHRSVAPRRSSGFAGVVPGARGLVGGTEDPDGTTRKAAGVEAGDRVGGALRNLSLDRVAAFPTLCLSGNDREAHFLADGAGEKSAHRMCLPTGGFHQFGECRALGVP